MGTIKRFSSGSTQVFIKLEKTARDIIIDAADNTAAKNCNIILFWQRFTVKAASGANGRHKKEATRTAIKSETPAGENFPVMTAASDIKIMHIAVFS